MEKLLRLLESRARTIAILCHIMIYGNPFRQALVLSEARAGGTSLGRAAGAVV